MEPIGGMKDFIHETGLTLARWAFRTCPSSLQVFVKRQSEDRAVKRRQQMAQDTLKAVARHLSNQCLADIKTLQNWKEQRSETKQKLRWMLGLDLDRAYGPVEAESTGAVDAPAYRLEKWLLQTMPRLFVTANLYLPKKSTGPRPCILYQNGHWPSLDGAKTGYQDRYLWYPENGFALLVIDPMGFGEIPGIHPGTNRLNRWDWLSRGFTPAGVEVWNGMRVLDWLQSRPEIDPDRIGATGISGGGVMTQYLAALDERIKVAAPSCSTYTIGHQVNAGLVPKQCDCTFYPNIFGIDFPEVLALFAPRPLLILGGRKDPIFPPAGYRAAFERVRRVYRLHTEINGREERVRLVESSGGHTDSQHFLEQTRAWMAKWLKADVPRGKCRARHQPAALTPAEQRVINRAPTNAVNGHVDKLWFPETPQAIPADKASWERRRADLMQILRSRIFHWFPEQNIPFQTRQLHSSGGYAGEIADFRDYEINSEPALPVRVQLLIPHGISGMVPVILWIKGAKEHVTFPDIDMFFPLIRTYALAILTPRFADCLLTPYAYARIERSAALLGRSIAAMQVWDILRAIEWLKQQQDVTIDGLTVYGRDESGIISLYAGLINENVGHIILRDPPTSQRTGPILPTILRHTDIEEVAGMFAPRRLTILANDRVHMPNTRDLFQLSGAGEAFESAPDVASVLLN